MNFTLFIAQTYCEVFSWYEYNTLIYYESLYSRGENIQGNNID